jgi:hypothetical protein
MIQPNQYSKLYNSKTTIVVNSVQSVTIELINSL